jgi:hypothetical protein
MAFALVGALGAATQGAAVNTAVTPAWDAGASRTAGNLLICFCASTGAGTFPTIPAGWSEARAQIGTSCAAGIYYKIATGADAAPTIAAIPSSRIAAQLAEFSGNATISPLDQNSFNGGTTSPRTFTMGAPDATSGELLVLAGADFRSAARTPNDTWTSNNATITQAGNNNGVSSVDHYSFGYGVTTSNASATTGVMTISTTTSVTGLIIVGATIKVAPVVVMPDLITEPMTAEVELE